MCRMISNIAQQQNQQQSLNDVQVRLLVSSCRTSPAMII